MIVKYKNAECMEAMHSQTLASKDSFSTSSLVMNFEGDNIDIVNFENDQDIASYMESGNVEYIEEDPIRYIYEVESKPITERDLEEIVGDVVPFGVNMVRALDVSDEFVGNRKVCVIDTGYESTEMVKSACISKGYLEAMVTSSLEALWYSSRVIVFRLEVM
jgi:hypothetical protein